MQSDPRHVTAIVAATDLTYLPQTLEALGRQDRHPDELIVVDVSAAGLDLGPLVEAAAAAGPTVRSVRAPQARNLGDAVRAGLDPGARTDWLWLLHDDSPPEPAALAQLLRATANTRTVAVAGCKHVQADHPDRLLSVGVRTTAGGRRLGGIDAGEIDQGQYDGIDDVYAVETAGMLLTREMWDLLGGPDPVLGPYGDGIDLSRRARLAGARVVVVPSAIVRHHRADLRDLRSEHPDGRRSVRRRREAILHARLTGASAPGMLLWFAIMVVMAPVRVLWRVATNEVGLATGELTAALAVALRPRAIWRARRRARSSRTVPRRTLRGLYAARREVVREHRDRILTRMTERRRAHAPSELEMRERAALSRRRRLVLAVVVLGAAAAGVLAGVEPVAGVDGSAGELLRSAFSPWIAAGDGHPGPPDPFWAVLALLVVVTGGPLGVPSATGLGVVVAASLPLAAISAWFAAGAATRSLAVRAWAAIVWALGPAAIVAFAGADLAALVCHITLPLLALAVARAFGYDRQDVIRSGLVDARSGATSRMSGRGSLGAAAGAGLLLAITAAAAPVVLPIALLVLVALALVVRRRARLVLVALPASCCSRPCSRRCRPSGPASSRPRERGPAPTCSR
ncbi:glycosyltransferase family 2 protein [Pseudactinotalea sp. HY158]|uniref:glycosyltransferase family 2 protein n=1 Tax=Pseudactinotalea sp. HY158 TaxID=2654547 RepID=UPI00129C96D8|nr:glycosyltransferase family 2 protein [Pseudactinotalea sp. HY158]QGH68838.1 glycosyltransferase [Pseudactinotalea sp. HY158]